MQAIQFSNLTLECSTRTLYNHKGNKIALRPRSYQVLLLLLQAKTTVSRDELFAQCWEGMAVTDQALTNVISSLRRNFLSLKASGVRIITITKVGYHLETDDTDVQIEECCFEEQPDKEEINSGSLLESREQSSSIAEKRVRFSLYTLVPLFIVVVLIIFFSLFNSNLLVTQPSFIDKHKYEHFVNGKTNYYLNDSTGGFIGVFELKQELKVLVPEICDMDVYIGLHPSVKKSHQVTLTVRLQDALNKHSGIYQFFEVDRFKMAQIIAEMITSKEVECE